MTALMLVEAIIRKEKFPELDAALKVIGVGGLTVMAARGRGRDKRTVTVLARGKWTYSTDYIDRVVVQTIVQESEVDGVVDAVLKSASTNSIGDGKVFVYPIQRAVDIGSGKADEFALAATRKAA